MRGATTDHIRDDGRGGDPRRGRNRWAANIRGEGAIDAHLPAGTHHFDELYFAQNTEEIEPTDAEDTALIVYTNTNPKGAELTQSQLYNSCTDAGELFGFRDEDIGGQRNGCVGS